MPLRRITPILLLVAVACSGGGEATTETTGLATTSTETTGLPTTTTTSVPASMLLVTAGTTARASAEAPGFPARHAVDGDRDTWWGAGSHPPQWIRLDFGVEVTVTSLTLVVSQDPPGETTHRVVTDGTTRQTIVRTTADLDVIEVTPDDPWTGVRSLEIHTDSSPSWVGWREIEVRGVVTDDSPGPVEAADIVFVGGPILTMGDAGTVDGLAVTDELITGVGLEEVTAAIGPDTEVIDLAGRALMPGFVDPHTHILNDAWRMELDTLGGQQLALENGITTLANMFTTPEFLDEMRGYESAGELRARISLYLIATDNCGAPQGDWWRDVSPTRHAGELLRIGGVKLFLDGGTCGAWATSTEIQPGGGSAVPFLTTEEIAAIVAAANATGHQVVIHSIGDVATLSALDAIEATTDPSNPLRHRVDHMTIVTDEVIGRFGRSGAVGMVFGYYPSCGEFEVTDFFADNVRRHPELIAANPGSVVAWHGDDPWVGPVSPLQELHNMVTRVEILDDGTECDPPAYLADRVFDVETGLRMMTIDAAYALHRESEVGSLEVGKYADLVVLGADPTAVPSRQIHDIEMLMTMVGGAVEVCADPAVCPE